MFGREGVYKSFRSELKISGCPRAVKAEGDNKICIFQAGKIQLVRWLEGPQLVRSSFFFETLQLLFLDFHLTCVLIIHKIKLQGSAYQRRLVHGT